MDEFKRTKMGTIGEDVHIGTIGYLDHNKTTLEKAINAYLDKMTKEDKTEQEKTYARKRKRVKQNLTH